MKCQQIWETLSVTDSLFFYPEGILRPFSYHSPTLLLSSTRLLSIQSYLCRTLLILNNFKVFFSISFLLLFLRAFFSFPFRTKEFKVEKHLLLFLKVYFLKPQLRASAYSDYSVMRLIRCLEKLFKLFQNF